MKFSTLSLFLLFFSASTFGQTSIQDEIRVGDGIAAPHSSLGVLHNPAGLVHLDGPGASVFYYNEFASPLNTNGHIGFMGEWGNRDIGFSAAYIYAMARYFSGAMTFGGAAHLRPLATAFGLSALYRSADGDFSLMAGALINPEGGFRVGLNVPISLSSSSVPAFGVGFAIVASQHFGFILDTSFGTRLNSYGAKPGIQLTFGQFTGSFAWGYTGGRGGGAQAATLIRNGITVDFAFRAFKYFGLELNVERGGGLRNFATLRLFGTF